MKKKPSVPIQFRAKLQDQERLKFLRGKLRMNNADVIREALRYLAEKKEK